MTTTTEQAPSGVLIRRRVVQKMLGITREVLEGMVESKRIRRIRLYDGGHWWYYRDEIERIAGSRS